MADTNTLDLSDLSSEPVESNVQAEISDAPADVEEPAEVDEEPEEVAEEPVAAKEAPVEAPSAPSTEEVVETVQTILTTDAPTVTKTTEERLNALIELLKSTCHEVEYDDNKYRWTGPFLEIREALNEL